MTLEFAIRPRLLYKLLKALHRHRKMEKEFMVRMADSIKNSVQFEFPNIQMNTYNYFSKNVFTIFIISILDHLRITPSRQHLYCMITHLIRGIVTAADNMLDDEGKGAVVIKDMNGSIVPNVSLILLQHSLLFQMISELTDDKTAIREITSELFRAMLEIGIEESSEENRIEQVLPPEELLGSIHHYRGGKLLTLPFVAPLLIEKNIAGQLESFKRAMYKIGMAVQMLDDITDFSIDIKSRNHNLLRSIIVHDKGKITTDNDLMTMVENTSVEPHVTFPGETRKVVNMAIESAMNGFDIMTQNGYPVDRSGAKILLKMLFEARKVGHLWELVQ